jgi:hypothetical protein
MTVPVSITDRTVRLKAKNVVVRIGGVWMPLESWLLQLPDREILGGTFKSAVISQQIWWGSNNKTFPLMKLPSELRRTVLEFVLGAPIYPRTKCCKVRGQRFVTLGEGKEPKYTDQGDGFIGYYEDWKKEYRRQQNQWLINTPNYEILSVSKQVQSEAIKAAWTGTLKNFRVLSVFKDVIECPNVPVNIEWINRIELEFSDSQYFQMFGVEVTPDITLDASKSEGQLFSRAPNLKDLRLGFRNPYDVVRGKNSTPWNDFYQQHRREDWFKDNHDHDPCRVAIVDYVLTFAFPHIKHIPIIRLTGCVKTYQKLKWERILATEYIQRHENYRTHGFDYQTELSEILRPTLVFWTPPCSCPLSCDRNKRDNSIEIEDFDHDDAFTPDMLERRLRLPMDHPYRETFFDPRVSEDDVDDARAELWLWDVVEWEAIRERIIGKLLQDALEETPPGDTNEKGFDRAQAEPNQKSTGEATNPDDVSAENKEPSFFETDWEYEGQVGKILRWRPDNLRTLLRFTYQEDLSFKDLQYARFDFGGQLGFAL